MSRSPPKERYQEQGFGDSSNFHGRYVNNHPMEPLVNSCPNANEKEYDHFLTNFVRIEVGDKPVYKYSVSFYPPIEPFGQRHKLINQHKSILGYPTSYDGTSLYLAQRLDSDDTVLSSFLDPENREIQLRTIFLEETNIKNCQSLVSVILTRILRHLSMQRVGKGYFQPDLQININNSKLSVWPGFSFAVHAVEDGLFWNIDTSFKIINNESVLDLMTELYRKSSDPSVDCARLLIGQSVITRYNNKTYRIDDIAWGESPKDSFEWKNGDQISFLDYYRQIYHLDITNTDQPLLLHFPTPTPNSRAKGEKKPPNSKTVALIPEFCFLIGISDEMRNDFSLMKEISFQANCSTPKKVEAINSLLKMIHSNEMVNEELNNWGFGLSKSMQRVKASKLPIESVYGRDSETALPTQAPGLWIQALKDIHPISTPELKNWICICVRRDVYTVEKFIKSLEKAAMSCLLNYRPPKLIIIQNSNKKNYIKALQGEVGKDNKPDLILSVFPSHREDLYSIFKKFSCCETAIPSQTVCTDKICDPESIMTFSTRVALQMNYKLGGELWKVYIPIKYVLVIGIDFYRCDVSKSKKLVIGFVSNLNDSLTKWYSRVAFLSNYSEIGESLKSLCTHAVTKFYEYNSAYPTRVIVYRDGVDKVTVENYKTLEVENIKKAIEEVITDHCCGLLYVLVKTHTRIRYFCENYDGTIVNPPCGSFIDSSIVSNEYPNFYLISQTITQGCSSPANFSVICNTTNLTFEQIRKFTYKCTHLYYNFPGTVSVPAPCLYAKKVALMAGEFLNAEALPELADKLYYL